MKKIIAVILAGIMFATMVTGCGSNEKIVVTVGGEKIIEPLYRLYLWTIQQQFESLTPNIWDMELEGKKTEDVAKDRALDSIKVSVAAKQKAKELGVELSAEEKQTIKTNAKQIMETRADLVKDLNLKQKDIEQFLTYGITIEKVTNKISESYVPNEEELKEDIELIRPQYETATVKHVLIQTIDEKRNPLPEDKQKEAKVLAEEVLQKALKGEDMGELAKKYSEDPGSKDKGGEYTFSKGQMVPEFEEVGFVTGKVGEVYPELVKTSFGYHIMKVEARSTGDEEVIKKASENRIKSKFAQTELTDLSAAITVEKAEGYEDIHIIRETPEEATQENTESNKESTNENTTQADDGNKTESKTTENK